MDGELVNPLINKELSTIKDIILGFVSIATNTDMVELRVVEAGFDAVQLLLHRDEKIQEYYECIDAIFNVVKFANSAQHKDMYNQFLVYITTAKFVLNGVDKNTEMIVGIVQSTYDLQNEGSKYADCIAKIIQCADGFGLLNNYWLNWQTEERIALLKKWACFYAYSQLSSESLVEPVTTKYSTEETTMTISDGRTLVIKYRSYVEEIFLTQQIEDEDLTCETVDGGLKITDYAGYDGKYNYVAIPAEIGGEKIVEIGPYAFEDMAIGSVIIPETVKKIDDFAFYNCCSLSKIVILNDSAVIANNAFDWNLGSANQSIGDVPVYCHPDSTAQKFANGKEGFIYKDIAWNGEDIWGLAALNKKYHIHCGAELAYMARLVNNGADLSGFTIVLDNDIDMNGKQMIPIGYSANYCYKGNFDGHNHSVKGYKSKTENKFSGIFGYVKSNNSSFLNVKISGKKESVSGSVGSLIGTAYVEKDCKLTIKNICSQVYDLDDSGTVRGGIVGTVNGDSSSSVIIENCINDSRVYTFATFGNNVSGGIAGTVKLNASSSIEFKRCCNRGVVMADIKGGYSTSYCGGIVGKAEEGNYKFSECAVDSTVQGTSYYTNCGALVSGFYPSSFVVENCEVFANVISKCTNGGSMCSGLIGRLYDTNLNSEKVNYIKNSYCSAVCEGDNIAAFVQCGSDLNNINLKIVNSYFDSGKTTLKAMHTPNSADGYLIMFVEYSMLASIHFPEDGRFVENSGAKSSYTLKNDKTLYENWDFSNVWEYTDSGYPKLRSFSCVPCYSHDYYQNIITPTCNEKGYTKYTCRICNYSYKGNYVDALGHDYSVYQKTVAPTCTGKGYDVYKCSRCSSTKNLNSVNSLGHDYQFTQSVVVSCADDGYDLYTCSRCNNTEKRNTVTAKGHSYVETDKKDATCTEDGYTVKTCTVCGDEVTATVTALGHKYVVTKVFPTCSSDGYLRHRCVRCNDSYNDSDENAVNHEFGAEPVDAYISSIYNESNKFISPNSNPLVFGDKVSSSSSVGVDSTGSNTVFVNYPSEIRIDNSKLSDLSKYRFQVKRGTYFTTQRTVDVAFAYRENTGRSPEESAIPYTDSEGNLINVNYVDYLADGEWHRGRFKENGEKIINADGETVAENYDSVRRHIEYTKAEALEAGIMNSDGTVNVTSQLIKDEEPHSVTFASGIDGIYLNMPSCKPSDSNGIYTSVFGFEEGACPSYGAYTVNLGFYNQNNTAYGSVLIKIFDKKEQYILDGSLESSHINLTEKCVYCNCVQCYDEDIDNSVLVAALEKTNSYDSDDYSAESYSNLTDKVNAYQYLTDNVAPQRDYDFATTEILTAISDLQPYLNLSVKGKNGNVQVSCEARSENSSVYSVLFGNEITLAAVPDSGYVFDGWYETTSKRLLSTESAFVFRITANTDIEARFIKENSASIFFKNSSGYIKATVTKTTEEWNNVASLSDLLPELPYEYGGTEGRWTYDETEVLTKLRNGENVDIFAEFSKNENPLPELPVPSDGVPALTLTYSLDAENNVGTFIMAAGIPEGCNVESIGIAFYYKKSAEFNPESFDVNINNKMLTSKFEASDESGHYTVDVNKFTDKFNWAVKGYVTYYDENGKLKTAYTNQVNIIGRQEV